MEETNNNMDDIELKNSEKVENEENENSNEQVNPVEPTDPDNSDGSDIPDVPVDPDNPDNPDEPAEPEVKYYYQTIDNFYDRVRSSLNSTGVKITDDLIDYPENAPMAERKLKSRVPTWEELEGDKKFLFDSAMVYMTCYMLCSVAYSNAVTEQTTPSLTLKYSANEGQRPCERFISLVDDLVAEINEETITNFLGFKVTEGSRQCCPRGIRMFW